MTPSATSQLPESETYSDPSGPKTGKFGRSHRDAVDSVGEGLPASVLLHAHDPSG